MAETSLQRVPLRCYIIIRTPRQGDFPIAGNKERLLANPGLVQKRSGFFGFYPEKFVEFDHVIESQHGNINGIVVVTKGHIAFEKY